MPISRDQAARYPKNWPEISAAIRQRAGNRCEFCGIQNYAIGCRDKSGHFLAARPVGEKLLSLEWPKPGDWAWCGNGYDEGQKRGKIIRIVLTVAHLDHTPENCADDNLKALCQRCHLRYDAEHHKANAARTRRLKSPQLDLIDAIRINPEISCHG